MEGNPATHICENFKTKPRDWNRIPKNFRTRGPSISTVITDFIDRCCHFGRMLSAAGIDGGPIGWSCEIKSRWEAYVCLVKSFGMDHNSLVVFQFKDVIVSVFFFQPKNIIILFFINVVTNTTIGLETIGPKKNNLRSSWPVEEEFNETRAIEWSWTLGSRATMPAQIQPHEQPSLGLGELRTRPTIKINIVFFFRKMISSFLGWIGFNASSQYWA